MILGMNGGVWNWIDVTEGGMPWTCAITQFAVSNGSAIRARIRSRVSQRLGDRDGFPLDMAPLMSTLWMRESSQRFPKDESRKSPPMSITALATSTPTIIALANTA